MKNVKWGKFVIDDLFHVKRGKRLIKNDRKSGEIPYYSATDNNNGLTDFISNPLFVEKNKILITTFGDAFFVEGEFTASDEITILHNNEINRYSGLFICEMIRNNIEKFKFGYKAFSGRIKRQTILLPLDEKNNVPDWDFMEQFIKDKEMKLLSKCKEYQENRLKTLNENILIKNNLDSRKWKEFEVKNVFSDIQRGKRLTKANQVPGKNPYISSTATNNGVDNYISNKENVRIFSNCTTLANSGSIGTCFYQPFEFVASDHVTKLANDNFNKYIYLFIGSILNRLSEKYSFNREINNNRLKKEKIILPVDDNDIPDWDFMESYMKQLEYKKISEYLDYIEDRMN